MKAKTSIIILFIIFITSLVFSGRKIKEDNLTEKYREFLKLTQYIILPQEEEVFMQLTSDRDRDIFIETFWKQRDPTLGTPENEYKEEHTKRFLYANKRYGRGTSREGWKTDMGRIYIILGPPVSIERFEATKGLYPTQVWYYYGDKKKRLPAHFGLIFFQRGGAGEYKLFDPVSDGQGSLMIHTRYSDPTNYKELYETIRELAPTLADVSISMIVGETPLSYQPSLINAILMADITESPKKDVNPTYATHFLDYKGMVSTEYMTNFMESDTQVALIQDTIMGLNFLHFSMVPKSLSVNYYEPKDQYYCNFTLDVSIRILDDIIFQYTKNFPIYFDPEEYDRIIETGIAFEDSFPVAEGEYKLIILLQNSIGKEFSIFEKKVVIPENSGGPQIVGPILGYKFEDFQAEMHIPFKILSKKLVIDPKNTFSAADNVSFFFNITSVSESLWNKGMVRVFISPVGGKKASQRSYVLELKNYPYKKFLNITQSIPASEFSPDYYEVKLTLTDKDGEVIDEKKENFIVSHAEIVSHPIAHVKAFSLSDNFVYFYMLAHQYEKMRDYKRAEVNFEKAYRLKPDDRKGLVGYANFLFNIKKFNKSLELIENIKEDENLKFEYYLVRGKAYMGMGKYSEAIQNLIEGNKIYNSDVSLLNSLGFSYFKTGKKKEALEILKASLRLNPEQKDVKKLIEKIENRRE